MGGTEKRARRAHWGVVELNDIVTRKESIAQKKKYADVKKKRKRKSDCTIGMGKRCQEASIKNRNEWIGKCHIA